MSFRLGIFRNAAVYFGANVLNAGIPFFLLPILTRVLTPADYGTVSMFTIAVTVLGAFTGLSMHGAVGVRYFQLNKESLAEYVGSCVGILACATGVTFAVVVLFRHAVARLSGVPTEWLVVAVVVSGLQVLGAIQLSLWQAAGKANAYATFQVAQGVLNVGLSLFLVLALGLAWQGRVLGQAVAIAVFGLLAIAFLVRGGFLKKPSAVAGPTRDALSFGVPLIPHVLGGLAISSGGQFIVTNVFGVAETGLYVVAAQLGAAMGLMSDAFVKTYGPWLYKRLTEDSPSGRHFIVGVTYCSFVAFLLVSAFVSAVVFWAFPLVVGEEFMRARAFTPFFVFANGFVGMYYAVAGFFFFSSKTHYVSIVTIVSGVSSILLMWALGHAFGLVGIAIGYLVSNITMFALAWLLSNWTCPMPWFEMRAAIAALSTTKVTK